MLTFTDKYNMICYDYPPLPSLELPESFETKGKKKRYLSDYFYQGSYYDIRGYFQSKRVITSLIK
jgi:hypothetical protein